MKRGTLAILISTLCLAGGTRGQTLAWPTPACKLKAESFHEYVEAYPMPRVRFTGCIEILGEPPRSYFVDLPQPENCSLELAHDLDPDIKIQLRVYHDEGATAFDKEKWSQLVSAAMGKLEGFTGVLEAPFDGDAAHGAPMMGYVSLECQLRLTRSAPDRVVRHRYCLVPLPEKGLVLLVGLLCDDEHFSSANAEFERFVRSLHRPS